MKLNPWLLAAVVFFSTSFYSATGLPQDPAPPPDFEAQYSNAEHSYLAGDAATANQIISKILALKNGASDPKTKVKAHNLRGLINFQNKRLSAAIQEFELAVDLASRTLPPTESVLHLARYNLINSLHQASRTADALQLIPQVESEALDKDTRIRFFSFGRKYICRIKRTTGVAKKLHSSCSEFRWPPHGRFISSKGLQPVEADLFC